MADNTTINATTAAGGPVYRDIDKAGVKTQVVTLDLGGAGAEALLAGALPVTGTFFQATQPVSGTVALDAASLAALETISVANFPATQAVSGPLTDTQLRAVAVPVSGAFFQATQPVSAASLPLPAGAATEPTLAGVRTDLGTDGTTPPAVLGAGTGVRGWLRSIYEKLTGTLAVTGTFWQATQPVSLASAPVTPVTDNAGSLTVDAPVGTPVFVQLSNGAAAIVTLPVGLAVNTPDVTDRAARALGTIANTTFGATLAAETTKVIGTVNIGSALVAGTAKIGGVDVLTLPALVAGTAVIGALVANQSVNNAQVGGVATAVGSGVSGTGVQRMVLATDVIQPAISEARAAIFHISVTAAVNTALTASLPAPAAGLFHYITHVELVKLYAVLGVAAAAGVIVTSTNLPAGTWTTEQAAGPLGTAPKVILYIPTTPLRCAAAATATTFVAPAQAQTIWRWNVSYFTAA